MKLNVEEISLILDFIGCAYQEGYRGDKDLYDTSRTVDIIFSIGSKIGLSEKSIKRIIDM